MFRMMMLSVMILVGFVSQCKADNYSTKNASADAAYYAALDKNLEVDAALATAIAKKNTAVATSIAAWAVYHSVEDSPNIDPYDLLAYYNSLVELDEAIDTYLTTTNKNATIADFDYYETKYNIFKSWTWTQWFFDAAGFSGAWTQQNNACLTVGATMDEDITRCNTAGIGFDYVKGCLDNGIAAMEADAAN